MKNLLFIAVLLLVLASCQDIVYINNVVPPDVDTVSVLNGIKVLNIQKDFGATGRIADDCDDTDAFQTAIDTATLTGDPIYLPNGTYCVSSVNLASNVRFIGESNTHTIIKSLPITGFNNPSTFYKGFSAGSIENVSFEKLMFDGDRASSTDNAHNVIGILLTNTETIKNLRVEKCVFKNVKQDAIRIIGNPGGSVMSDNIRVTNSHFIGGEDSDASDFFSDAVRIELYDQDYPVSGGAYGEIFIQNISIENCYAENIRTLADVKRGCKNFIVTSCITKNMHDCHYSVDGSFNGIISNCVGSMEAGFVPATGTNFIEVQGEQISIDGVSFDGNFITQRGIQITDYGTSAENGVGHVSKRIQINNANLANIVDQGIKLINANDARITNCTVDSVGHHPIIIDSGIARVDENSNPLTSKNVFLSGNVFSKAGLGIGIVGTGHILGDGNLNEFGSTPLQIGSSGLVTKNETDFTVTSRGREYNPNPNMYVNGSTTRVDHFNTGETGRTLDVNNKPAGAAGSVVLEDNSSSTLGVVQMDEVIPATKGQVIHLSIFGQQSGANTAFSLVVQEYNGGSFISSTFYGTTYLSTSWKNFICNHKVINASTNNLVVQIVPSTNFNYAPATGSVAVAQFAVSDRPLGIR
jgi:hypothetical protein